MRSRKEAGWTDILYVSRFFSRYVDLITSNKSAEPVRSKETVLNSGTIPSVEPRHPTQFLCGFLPSVCHRFIQSCQRQSNLKLHLRNIYMQFLGDCFIWQSVKRVCEKYLAHLLRHISYRSFEASTVRRVRSGRKGSRDFHPSANPACSVRVDLDHPLILINSEE